MSGQSLRKRHPFSPVYSEISEVFGATANPNLESQVSEKPTLNDVIRMLMTLYYDNVALRENVMRLQDEVKTVRELLESRLDKQDEPDSYDMPVEDIKKLITKECKPGQQYYPGDLAFKHGLNYDTVLEAVASLKEEGHVQY